ncbi:MAG: hypothetical protein R6V53_07105 [Candidatus Woesearchaeota archaeon]
MKYYIYYILIIVALVSGCASNIEPQSLPERYSVPKGTDLPDSKLHIPDKITLEAEKEDKVHIGIKNTKNKTLCFYLQPTCKVVLGGLDCDTKTMTENSDYYWEWFHLPESVYLKPFEEIAIAGIMTPKGSQDTYLGTLKAWMGEPAEKSCPSIQYYNEKKDLSLYAEEDFQITLE